MEDVFYILRDDPNKLTLVFDTLFDLVFQSSDFLKQEVEKLQEDPYLPANPAGLIDALHQQVHALKQEKGAPTTAVESAGSALPVPVEGGYVIHVTFEEDCQMENMRAYMLLTQLQHCCDPLTSVPEHPESNPSTAEQIQKDGFDLYCKPLTSIEQVCKIIESASSIKSRSEERRVGKEC